MDDMSAWPSQAAFISGSHLSNIAITGTGTVDGSGAVWWPHKSSFRPTLVKLEAVTTVLITGVTFMNSPNHNLELYTDDTEVYDVSILAPSDSPNTDGIDVHGTAPTFNYAPWLTLDTVHRVHSLTRVAVLGAPLDDLSG